MSVSTFCRFNNLEYFNLKWKWQAETGLFNHWPILNIIDYFPIHYCASLICPLLLPIRKTT
jgi:hypothetical protein